MRTLVLVVTSIFALPTFAQTQFEHKSIEAELKSHYDGATEVPTLDDFDDVKTNPKKQFCSYWSSNQTLPLAFGRFTKTWNEGGEHSGPLFRNRDRSKHTLVFNLRASNWDDDVDKSQVESKSTELYWSIDNTVMRFRKDSEYIYFMLEWRRNIYYGYCWREK